MTTNVVWTAYGKSALAQAIQGTYAAPLYLVIENNGSTITGGPYAVGVTSIQSVARVDLTGDASIVLGAGLSTQETVPFSAVSGTGPYIYTLSSPTTQTHATGDPICRLPLSSDTMAQVVNEIQFDSTNVPNQRLQTVSGYSSGAGQWTMQFYLTGIEASSFLMTVGLSDNPTIGQGNLHAHAVLGINHVYNQSAGGVDIEIDIPLTIN